MWPAKPTFTGFGYVLETCSDCRVFQMRKTSTLISLCLAFFTIATIVSGTAPAIAQSPNANGLYDDLIRSYECRRDRTQYGSYYNWGYWKGGRWCGHNMPGGYYVYQDGVWYIWAAKADVGAGRQDGAGHSDAAAQMEQQ